MHTARLRRIALPCLLLACAGAAADSWAPPGPAAAVAEDGAMLVRIEPAWANGGNRSDAERPTARLYRFDPDLDGYRFATAYALRDRLAPVDVLLTAAGGLITLDEWGRMGAGEVLRVYGPGGEIVRAYTLQALLGPALAAAAPSTVSSTWWRCGKPGLDATGHLQVTTYDGGRLSVNLADGSVMHAPGARPCR